MAFVLGELYIFIAGVLYIFSTAYSYGTGRQGPVFLGFGAGFVAAATTIFFVGTSQAEAGSENED